MWTFLRLFIHIAKPLLCVGWFSSHSEQNTDFQLLLSWQYGLDFSSSSAKQGPRPPSGLALHWFLFSGINTFGIKRVCAIIVSYCSWKQYLFSAAPFWLHFFQGEIRHETTLCISPTHPHTHTSHFLPDLKCNSHGVAPIIRVNMMPLPRSLVTVIYNLWIQPRSQAKRKWTWVLSVCGNEITFQFRVTTPLCSFSCLHLFPNLLP